MKVMNLKLATGTVGAVLLSFAMAPAGIAQGAVTLRLSSPNSATQPYTLGAKRFAELVKKATNGSVKVQVFPDNQLGSPTAVAQGVQLGTIDLGIVASAHLAPYNRQIGALDLPFLFPDKKAAYTKLDGALGAMLSRGLQPKNMLVLAWFDGGFRNIFNVRGPIKTPAGLKGLKMRVINSPVTIATMKALGATPVPLAWSELYTGLQQGVVDGGSTGITQMWSQKFYEVAKYVSLTHTVFTAGPLVISKRKFDSLSLSQRSAVRSAAKEAAQYQRQLEQKAEAATAKKLEAAGLKFNQVDKGKFRAAVKPVWNKYGKEFPPALMALLDK